MAPPPRDEPIELHEFETRGGDDSPPLVNKVPDPPPAGWGKITGTNRTLSPAYVAFLQRSRSDGHRQ